VIGLIRSLFFRPPILQVAALCWRGGPEVLLIRSLDSNRWILPKGWPMRGKTLAEAAEVEAWEEAGVKGHIRPDAIGHFETAKRRASGVKQPCRIEVFALEVVSVCTDFPEAGQRKAQWFCLGEAVENLREPALGDLILSHFRQIG